MNSMLGGPPRISSTTATSDCAGASIVSIAQTSAAADALGVIFMFDTPNNRAPRRQKLPQGRDVFQFNLGMSSDITDRGTIGSD